MRIRTSSEGQKRKRAKEVKVERIFNIIFVLIECAWTIQITRNSLFSGFKTKTPHLTFGAVVPFPFGGKFKSRFKTSKRTISCENFLKSFWEESIRYFEYQIKKVFKKIELRTSEKTWQISFPVTSVAKNLNDYIEKSRAFLTLSSTLDLDLAGITF